MTTTLTVVGSVQTRADLDRMQDVPPGVAWRIADEAAVVMWDGAGWVPVPPDQLAAQSAGDAGAGRALVGGHWPYVVGSDMVTAYPEVSHDLANKAAALNDHVNQLETNWVSWRDGKAWWEKEGDGGRLPGHDLYVTPPPVEGWYEGGLHLAAGKPARLEWCRGKAWHTLYIIDWQTAGTNGPAIVSGQFQCRWILTHAENAFYGHFYPIGRAAPLVSTGPARLIEPDPAAAPAGAGPLPAGAFDLAATLAGLIDTVNQLAARIDALEGAAP